MSEQTNSNANTECNCKMCQKWGWCPAGKCHKIIKIILLLIVLGLIISVFCHHGDRKDTANQNTIVVSGKGEVTVKPDMATLSFSVTDENMDVAKASDAVNTKITAIVSALEADGVAEADIKTTDYSIDPQYNYVNTVTPVNGMYMPGKQVLAGYNVTDGISINIKDLSKASKIVTDLGGLTVTDMSGLTFTNSNEDALTKQARDEAVADARTQAASLAKSLGVKLDKIVGYSDDQLNAMYGAMKTTAMPMAADVSAVLPSGQNTITSNVTITYEIQ